MLYDITHPSLLFNKGKVFSVRVFSYIVSQSENTREKKNWIQISLEWISHIFPQLSIDISPSTNVRPPVKHLQLSSRYINKLLLFLISYLQWPFFHAPSIIRYREKAKERKGHQILIKMRKSEENLRKEWKIENMCCCVVEELSTKHRKSFDPYLYEGVTYWQYLVIIIK